MLRLVLIALLLATPALAAEKRVWRVDSAVATQAGGTVVLDVRGAVQSGGWSRPRLKAAHGGDARTLVVEFVAQAPSPNAMVIDGLLPMAAKLTINAAHGAVAVKVLGQANEVTTQILR